MATPSNYVITLSDGTRSFTVAPTTNNTQTSITMIGQNAVDYGDDINRNMVNLMEHFSNDVPPSNPIRGQIWFKTDYSYNAGFTGYYTSAGYDFGYGDFLPRIYITRSQTENGSTGYWTTIPTTIVDVNIPSSRSDYITTPGHLWLDVNPSDDAVPATNTYYDHSILKVFDPISSTWLSVAANYVLLKGNQTITGDILIDGTFEVNDAATFNSTLNVTGPTVLSSTLNVTGAAVLSSTLDVTGAAVLSSTLDVSYTSVFNGTATFAAIGTGLSVTNDGNIGGTLSVLQDASVGDMLTADKLTVIATSSMTGLVTIDLSDPFQTALNVVGSVMFNGDVSISGSGVGNLTTSSNILVGDSLTVANNLTVNTGTVTCLDIDVTNHTVKNLLDPINPQEAATKNYVDSFYLRRDTGLSSIENTMSAILLLDNVNQNSAPNSATTKQWVTDNLNLKVDRAGDTITGLLTIDVGGSGTGLNVIGDVSVTSLLTTNDIAVNDVAVFNGEFNVRNTLKVYTDRASLENKFIESVAMRTTPLPTDVPNVQYITAAVSNIQNNFAKINPTTPKEGDLRIIASPLSVSIYANNDWRQIYPAVYA